MRFLATKTFAVAIAFTLTAFAGSSRAGVSISLERDLFVSFAPGFSNWTVILESDMGPINALDARFDGPLNQFQYLGNPTPFEFNTFVIDPPPELRDSHFLFKESDVLALQASESATHLEAIFANLDSLQPDGMNVSLPLAQLIIPDGSLVDYNFEIALAEQPVTLTGQVGAVPEPATALLALSLLFAVSELARLRRA